MINLLLGFLFGFVAAFLLFKGVSQAWCVWALFIIGAATVIFGFDVLLGSIKEHEKRAATLGFLMFAVPGVILIAASLFLGF